LILSFVMASDHKAQSLPMQSLSVSGSQDLIHDYVDD